MALAGRSLGPANCPRVSQISIMLWYLRQQTTGLTVPDCLGMDSRARTWRTLAYRKELAGSIGAESYQLEEKGNRR